MHVAARVRDEKHSACLLFFATRNVYVLWRLKDACFSCVVQFLAPREIYGFSSKDSFESVSNFYERLSLRCELLASVEH